MPIDRHVLTPAQSEAIIAQLTEGKGAIESERRRLERHCADLEYVSRVEHNTLVLAEIASLRRDLRERIPDALRGYDDALAVTRARAAAWTPADAAREQLVTQWHTLQSVTERRLSVLRDMGGRPELKLQADLDAFVAAHQELRALGAALEPLVCEPGEHPYTNRTEQTPAMVLGRALASRLRPVERPARYPWQDLADTARGVPTPAASLTAA